MSMFRRGDDSESEAEEDVTLDGLLGQLDHGRANREEDKLASGEEDDEPGMFGNLHELDGSLPVAGPSGSNSSTVIKVREFPLPKHMPSSLVLPKKLLSEVLLSTGSTNAERAAAKGRAKDLHPVFEYREISGGSRAKRVELEIQWIKAESHMERKQAGGQGSKNKGKLNSGRTIRPGNPSALWPEDEPSPVQWGRRDNATSSPQVASTATSTPVSGSATPLESAGNSESEDEAFTRVQIASPAGVGTTSRHPTVKHALRYAMHSIACPSIHEAENYVSTIALHQLTTRTDHENAGRLGLQPPLSADKTDNAVISFDETPPSRTTPLPTYPAVNPKSLPLMYRDLWDELEHVRMEREHGSSRKIWGVLEQIVDHQEHTATDIIAPVNGGRSDRPLKAKDDFVGATSRNVTTELRFVQQIKDEWDRRSNSKAYLDMMSQRNSLPIAGFREEIVKTMHNNQVMILSGETGCGKSTQLPSFILEDCLAQGQDCKIYVTEPRRISAISLAQRVAKELGDQGANKGDGLVGYAIRLENHIGPKTRLAFVTNGIALRMLEADSDSGAKGKGSAFDQVTHIIIDEVHERSIDSDFLLIVLKSLMCARKDLKVVLMSATLDAQKISSYFDNCPILTVPGRTFPVRVSYLEDAVQFADYALDPSSPYALRARDRRGGRFSTLEWADDDDDSDDTESKGSDPLKLSSSLYSRQTIDTVNLLDPRQIPYELVVRVLERLCLEEGEYVQFSHAILIFLPGLQEIRKMHDALVEHKVFGNPDAFILFPLHSTISSEGQSAVFDIPLQGVRKIVIATNIAETGITIPDITAVIDSGKHREMTYDEKRQISRLTETYIARSNATQRRGRAGRVQEGMAFHLFTRARFEHQMAPHPIPEMLRLSLQDLALRIKILKINLGSSVSHALASALDPPNPVNVMRAVSSLVEVGALTAADEAITPLGRLLSRLPVDVHLGKFLLYSALFGCLDPALTIAATLNAKSPFVTPFGQEQQADTIKASFKKGNSDFLTLHNVYTIWKKMSSTNSHSVWNWCKRNFLSQQTLGQIEELRQQLYSYLVETDFVKVTDKEREAISRARFSRGWKTNFLELPTNLNYNAEDEAMVNAALAAGLYPKLLAIDQANGGLKTLINNQAISIHPSSVNFRMPLNEFASNYVVYFTIMQSKRLYAWETGPVADLAVFILCGEIVDYKLWAQTSTTDRKLRFCMPPKTLLAVRSLREGFAQAISQRLRSKPLTSDQEKWWAVAMKCLQTPEKEEREAVLERIGVTL